MVWGGIIIGIGALFIGFGTIWHSLATGRIVFQGRQIATREATPVRFWLYLVIAFAAGCAIFCLLLPLVFVPKD